MHYLLGRGLAGAAGFATLILLVRYMDVQAYAGFTALSGVIVLAGILAGLGLERAISRFIPEARLERSVSELKKFIFDLTIIKLAAILVICLIFYNFWDNILNIFPDIQLSKFPTVLLIFVVAETLFQHFSSVLQALIKQKELTRILLVQWAGRLAMIAWAIYGDRYISLEEVLWVMAVPEAIGVFVFVLVIYKHLNNLENHQKMPNIRGQSSWPNWHDVSKMAGSNYGFTLLAAPPQGYFMKMLAAAFLPTQMVAAYGFFINVAERTRQYIPLHFLYNLIEPVMISSYLQNKDFKTLSNRCQLLYKSNLLFFVPLLAWVASAGVFIVISLTGGKYQEYLWLLLVVMLQLALGSHVVLLQLILNSIGQSRTLIFAGFFALTGMLLYIILATTFDPVLLVLGPLLFSFLCNIYTIRAINNQGYSYKVQWKLYAGLMLAGAIAFLFVIFTISSKFLSFDSPFLMSIVSGFLIAIIYLPALYFLKVIQANEILLVKSIFNKKNHSEKLALENPINLETSIIFRLQSEAKAVLDKLIPHGASIILLDYPNNTNVGDSLIWLGEIAYLKSRGFKPSYVCDVKNYDAKAIKKILNNNSVILMHGGGNLGTVWNEIHEFRMKVLQDFPTIPTVQMPQTIHFDDETKLVEFAKIIKRHKNYTLLARCQKSLEFSIKNLTNSTFLCPDMAFFIGPVLLKFEPHCDHLVLSRTDHEKSNENLMELFSKTISKSHETVDWLQASMFEKCLYRFEKHTLLCRKYLDPNNRLLLLLWNKLSKLRLVRGASLLGRGRIVLTDRLHAHILSILMDKPHLIADNSYGKISEFYKTWTSNHVDAALVKDLETLIKASNLLANFLITQKVQSTK